MAVSTSQPNRSQTLQALLDQMASNWNIDDAVIAGTDHAYNCRCDTCLKWWVAVGPEYEDEDSEPTFGPFTKEEFLTAGGVLREG